MSSKSIQEIWNSLRQRHAGVYRFYYDRERGLRRFEAKPKILGGLPTVPVDHYVQYGQPIPQSFVGSISRLQDAETRIYKAMRELWLRLEVTGVITSDNVGGFR